jgi:O-antigen/teichoic acid export membrane protein
LLSKDKVEENVEKRADGESRMSYVQDETAVPTVEPDGSSFSYWKDRLRDLLKRGFVRNVMATFTTRVILIVVGLVTTVMVARILGPTGRGLYAVATAIGLIGVQFGCLGMNASNIYIVSKKRSDLPRLVGNSLMVSLAVGIAAIGATYVAFGIWPRMAPLHGWLLLLGLLWTPIGTAYLLTQNLLLGVDEVKTYNLTETANRVLALIVIGCLVLTHRISPTLAFAAGLISMAAMLGVIVARLMRISGEWPRPSMALFRSNLSYGMRAYLMNFFCYLVIRSDVLMLKYMRGALDSGLYSIAFTMSDYVGILPVLIGLLLLPKISAIEDVIEKYRMMKKATIGAVLIQGPVVLISAALAPWAVELLFGKAYALSVPAYLWLCPGAIFLTIHVVAVQFLNGIGFPMSVVWIWLGTVVLKISLNLWLIPFYGLRGAAMASSACYVVACVLVLMVIRREVRRVSSARAKGIVTEEAISSEV